MYKIGLKNEKGRVIIMKKKKRFSILKCFISIICVIFIAVTVAVNIIYSQNKTPNLMGRYFYIVTENDTNGISDVTAGSAIIAKEATNISVAQKDLVLCYPAGDPNNLRLCGIYNVIQGDDGIEKYQLYYDGHEDNDNLITKEAIAAVCTGYPESAELGSFITFTRSIPGIVAELIIPCIILLVFFISRISSKEEEAEDEEIFEFSNNKKSAKNNSKNAPLFEPSQEVQASDDLERKKMSIAENFSQKKVNPNSPYQKEKERTMQFKAANRPDSAKTTGRVSPAPSADSIREDIRRKNEYEGSHVRKLEKVEPAERTEPVEKKEYEPVRNETIIDNTGIIPTSQIAEMSKNAEASRSTVSEVKAAAPKRSSSPDISDIISKSEASKRKKNVSNMSVDDLLKIIEEEKNKL